MQELLDFLNRIACRNNGDTSELQFFKTYYKIQIVLAVNNSTYNARGMEYYSNKIKVALDHGIESIYIFGLGNKREMARDLGECVKEEDLRIKEVMYHQYQHRQGGQGKKQIGGICVEIVLWQDDDCDTQYQQA